MAPRIALFRCLTRIRRPARPIRSAATTLVAAGATAVPHAVPAALVCGMCPAWYSRRETPMQKVLLTFVGFHDPFHKSAAARLLGVTPQAVGKYQRAGEGQQA